MLGCSDGVYSYDGRADPNPTGATDARYAAAPRGSARQERNELAHVVEDDRPGAPKTVRRRDATGVAEGAHARGTSRLDSGGAVLDDRAPRWRHLHGCCRMEEQIRCRLAAGDIAGAEDAAVEALEQSDEPKAGPDLFVRAAGGYARRRTRRQGTGARLASPIRSSRATPLPAGRRRSAGGEPTLSARYELCS